MKYTAIVLAAGKGTRMQSNVSKQFMELGGKPVVYYSLKAFEAIKPGASRWKQTDKIETKLLNELNKEGLKVVKVNTTEDRYKASCGTYHRLEDDSERIVDVETRKGYLSEIYSYIELEASLE